MITEENFEMLQENCNSNQPKEVSAGLHGFLNVPLVSFRIIVLHTS